MFTASSPPRNEPKKSPSAIRSESLSTINPAL